MLALARQENLEFAERLVGLEKAIFLAVRVRRYDHQKLLGFALENVGDEGLIVLLIDELILYRVGADDMTIDLVLAQRRLILFTVK